MKDEFHEKFYNEDSEFNGGYMKKTIDLGGSGEVLQLKVNLFSYFSLCSLCSDQLFHIPDCLHIFVSYYQTFLSPTIVV